MNSGSRPWAPRYFELPASIWEPPCIPRVPKSPCEPETRDVAPVSEPDSCAMTRSTGPPGANCTTTNDTSRIPKRVGTISSRRRTIDAAMSARSHEPGRLIAIVPPRLQHAGGVARLGGRPREDVPVCHPVRRLVPVRNPVAPGADQPIEATASRYQFRSGVGRDDAVDHVVDGRVVDAGQVLRALHLRRLR